VNGGIFLALCAYAVYAWGDGLIKAIGGQLSIFEIGFFNILFAGIFLFFLKPDGERWHGFWRMQRPWAVHARAISGLVAACSSSTPSPRSRWPRSTR
jgi:drug/metabolite transporter (DMT)-like permease